MPRTFRATALVAVLWTAATVNAQEFEGERLLSPGGAAAVRLARAAN